MEKWVTDAARTTTRKEYLNLRKSNDPAAVNEKCWRLTQLLTNGKAMEEIEHTDPLFELYVNRLSTHTAASIMLSVQVQNNLARRNDRHFTLADTILAVDDQDVMSAATTPSFKWTPTSHRGTTQPTQHDDPDAMVLSIIRRMAMDICNRCHGNGHHARDCTTPDPTRGTQHRR
jgi:hypothetical protein